MWDYERVGLRGERREGKGRVLARRRKGGEEVVVGLTEGEASTAVDGGAGSDHRFDALAKVDAGAVTRKNGKVSFGKKREGREGNEEKRTNRHSKASTPPDGRHSTRSALQSYQRARPSSATQPCNGP
jgi:hypothetical protein